MKKRIIALLTTIFMICQIFVIPSQVVLASGYANCERVTYISEDFEGLDEGAINGQGSWVVTQGDSSVANVLSENGNKMLTFSRTAKDQTQRITLTPAMDIAVSFNESDKLALSFDFITSSKGQSDSDRLYYIDLGLGKDTEIAFHLERGRIDSNTGGGYMYFNGSSASGFKAFNTNQPYHIELIFDYMGKKVEAYLDGILAGEAIMKEGRISDPSKLSQLQIWSYSNGNIKSPQYIDNLKVEKIVMTDEDICNLDIAEVDAIFESTSLTDDINLPKTGKNGTVIKWTTSDEEIITAEGKITRTLEDQRAQLNAEFTFGNYTTIKTYSVTVLKLDKLLEPTLELLTSAVERFSFSEISSCSEKKVTEDLALINEYTKGKAATFGGMDIKWTTANDEVIKSDGKLGFVTSATQVQFTGEFSAKTKPEIKTTKTFFLTVYPKGTEYVAFEETFDNLEQGDINGQNLWSARYLFEDSADPTAKVTDNNGNNVLRFDRTAATNLLYLDREIEAVAPEIGSIVSVSYDYEKGPGSMWGYQLNFGLGNVTFYAPQARLDVEFSDMGYIYLNGSPSLMHEGNHHIEYLMDLQNQKIQVLYDGNIVGSGNLSVLGSVHSFNFRWPRNGNDGGRWQQIDNIKVVKKSFDMNEMLSDAADSLEKLFGNGIITENIALPSDGKHNTTIKWVTSDETVINEFGEINYDIEDKTVTLTATVSLGERVVTKTFDLTVPKVEEIVAPTQELLDAAVEEFEFSEISKESPSAITQNLNLIKEYNRRKAMLFGGMNISWESGNSDVLNADGEVTRTKNAEDVVLKATFTAKDNSSIKKTVEYNLGILSKGDILLYEDFEDFELRQIAPFETVNGWYHDDWDDKTYTRDAVYEIVREPQQGNKRNKALYQVKNAATSISTAQKILYNLEEPQKDGIVEFSFDLMFKNVNNYNCLQFNFDANLFLEIRSNRIQNSSHPYDFKAGEWYHFRIPVDIDASTSEVYINSEKIIDLPMSLSTISKIYFYSIRTDTNVVGKPWLIDNVVVNKLDYPYQDQVENAADCLELALEDEVGDDFALPTTGEDNTTIVWSSSDETVIKPTKGKARVTLGEEAKNVVLTAHIYKVQGYKEKEFTVRVKAFDNILKNPDEDTIKNIADDFSFGEISAEGINAVMKDLNLPTEWNEGEAQRIGGTDIIWSSDKPYVIANNGKVVNQKYDVAVKLTAKFVSKTNPELSAEKSFDVIVVPNGSYVMYENLEDAALEDMYKNINYKGIELIYDAAYENTNDVKILFDPEDPYNKLIKVTRGRLDNGKPPYVGSTAVRKILDEPLATGTYRASMRVMMASGNALPSLHRKFSDSVAAMTTLRKDQAGGTKFASLGMGEAPQNQWHTLTVIFNQDLSKEYCFFNGVRMTPNLEDMRSSRALTDFGFISSRAQDGPNSVWYVDNLSLMKLENTDALDVMETVDKLEVDASAPQLITRGDNGTKIAWTSSDNEIIDSIGHIGEKSGNVTVTATVTKGVETATKAFNLYISAKSDYPCEISGIDGEDALLKSVCYSSSYDNESYAVVEIYYKGELKDIRITNVATAYNGKIDFVNPIDVGNYSKYTVRAYVMDKNSGERISKVYVQ